MCIGGRVVQSETVDREPLLLGDSSFRPIGAPQSVLQSFVMSENTIRALMLCTMLTFSSGRGGLKSLSRH